VSPHKAGAVPAIELTGATKRFRTPSGTLHTAVRDLDLTVAPGEFVAVVGPTGCGKSTTLTLVSGLEEPTEGEVKVHGEHVDGINPHVGFVFQQDAVFPWRTVLSNVMAGPRFRGVPKAEARERARDWLARVGLSAFEDPSIDSLDVRARRARLVGWHSSRDRVGFALRRRRIVSGSAVDRL